MSVRRESRDGSRTVGVAGEGPTAEVAKLVPSGVTGRQDRRGGYYPSQRRRSVEQDRGSGELREFAEVVRMWAKRQHDGGRARRHRDAVRTRGGSPATVSGYSHKGLEGRIGWLGDGAGTEPWYRLICDERWQRVAAHGGSDASAVERFVYHNAGAKGCRGECDGARCAPGRPIVTARHRSPSEQGLRWHDFNATRRCAKMLVGHCRT